MGRAWSRLGVRGEIGDWRNDEIISRKMMLWDCDGLTTLYHRDTTGQMALWEKRKVEEDMMILSYSELVRGSE